MAWQHVSPELRGAWLAYAYRKGEEGGVSSLGSLRPWLQSRVHLAPLYPAPLSVAIPAQESVLPYYCLFQTIGAQRVVI